jgi:hypothetical protein
MGCFEINGGSAIVIEGCFPACHAYAPFIAGLQTGKSPFRTGRDQVVSIKHRKIEKFPRHLNANRMLPNVLRPGSTVAVAIKSGYGVATATSQFSSEDICRHGQG